MYRKIKFHSNSPILKYSRNSLNSRCYSSLAPAFTIILKTKDANAISMRLEEPLKNEGVNSIDLENVIFKNGFLVGGERFYFSLKI